MSFNNIRNGRYILPMENLKSPETVKPSQIQKGPKTLPPNRHPGQVSLHRPSELVLGTAEIRSVFPDLQLLRGRMVGTVVSGQVGGRWEELLG